MGTSARTAAREPTNSEHAFRILVLGDFGGEPGEAPVEIDPELLEDAPGRMGAAIDLMVAGEPVSVRIESFEDFHPDSLYLELPLFRALRGLRDRLEDPATFAAAASELAAATVASETEPTTATDLDALDMIVAAEEQKANPRGRSTRGDPWKDVIRSIVAPHLEPRPDPRQKDLVAEVDEAASALMRSILHDPGFQAVEAAWRSVDFLLRRVETGPDLTVHIVHAAGDDMVARLPELAKLDDWTLIVAISAFVPDEPGVARLTAAAAIAEHSGVPFLAAASNPDDWTKERLPESFQALRTTAAARWVGLAAPRFLLRLPYGKRTSASDYFAFEEMPGEPVHGDYLWANPAIGGACLLAQAFARDGWQMTPGSINRLTSMPVHVLGTGPDSTMTPCAEYWLTDIDAGRLLDCGVMPLVSLKKQDVVLWPWFSSLADPPAPLGGRWNTNLD